MPLDLKNVSVTYGGCDVLSDVSISLPERGLLLLVGANGSGKSTLLDVLSGEVRPSRGLIVDDREQRIPRRRLRSISSRLYQRIAIPPSITPAQLLDFALFGQSLDGLVRPTRSFDSLLQTGRIHPAVLSLIVAASALSSAELWTTPFARLSIGQQRLGLLVSTLSMSRTVLLLDEPLAGLARPLKAEVLQAVRELAKERMIVLVEHDYSEIVCDSTQVVGLVAGRIDPETLLSGHAGTNGGATLKEGEGR